ncbi:MAG: hypothetical protein GY878_18405, partial [Fuerstiella sp.]|nr:hypothetical protein [Fuerstiella sp.]
SGDISVNQLATLSAASITLGDSAGNATNFGSLIFNSAGAVTISEDSSMTVAGPSTAGDGLALSSAGDMRSNGTVDVTGDTTLLATGGIEVNAKLNGSGAIVLLATDDITVNAEIDPTSVTLRSDDDILIHASTLASNLIELSAGEDGTGGIEITSAGSLETTAAGSDITLATGNVGGDVLLTGSMTALDQVTVTSDAGSVALEGTLSSDSLSVTATGDLSDGGSGDISVNQLATLSASSIALGDSAGNATNFGNLIFNSAGVVAISEDSSMLVAGPSTAGDGLALSSAGEMGLNGTIDVTGDTTLSATGELEV